MNKINPVSPPQGKTRASVRALPPLGNCPDGAGMLPSGPFLSKRGRPLTPPAPDGRDILRGYRGRPLGADDRPLGEWIGDVIGCGCLFLIIIALTVFAGVLQ